MKHAPHHLHTNENYSPSCKLLTENRDIRSYRNLENWSKLLCEKFDHAVAPYIGDVSFSENRDIEVLINNYTYILLFKGELNKSRDTLVSVIDCWSKKYAVSHDIEYVKKAIQPIINLARLSLIECKYEEFWDIINGLNDFNSSGYIKLQNIKIAPTELSSHLDFISKVTFKEKIKIYLKMGLYEEIIKLEQDNSSELIKSIYYREAQIVALMNLSKYDKAVSTIRGVMYRTSGAIQNIFHYRLYEVYLCQGLVKESDDVINCIYRELSESTLHDLRDLMFSMLIISTLRLDENDRLSQKVRLQLENIDDEFNYTNMMLSFYRSSKDERVKKELSDVYSRTQYSQVRRGISSELNLGATNISSRWNEKLSSKLDLVLCSA